MMIEADQRKTFLFSTIDAIGHLNCALALAKVIAKRGHRIYFFTKGYKTAIIESYGFTPVIIIDNDISSEDAPLNQLVSRVIPYFRKPRIEALSSWNLHGKKSHNLITKHKVYEKMILKAIDQVKPDIIITDFILPMPALFRLDIPWVCLHSANPLGLFQEYGPPRAAGYSVDSSIELWEEFRARESIEKKELRRVIKEWFAEYNLTIDHPHSRMWTPPLLGIYMYPEVVDYSECGPRIPNWFRIDPLLRSSDSEPFEVPKEILNGSGALVYFSLGTLGSSDYELMERLIGMLSKSEHRFIVSKGLQADKFSLPSNMWGDAYVNQLKVLPLVDLVITHGGNNTLCETLYFGKPMIVMPLFADQHDNAQRIEDKKLGKRINPYSVEQDDLLNVINELITDKRLNWKLEGIRKAIQSSTTDVQAIILIEKILKEKKNPFKLFTD